MTVQELIEKLEKLDDKDRRVMLSSDPEGNAFHRLEDIGTHIWDQGYMVDEDDPDAYGDRVVVLWP